jgi:hypothetical protein
MSAPRTSRRRVLLLMSAFAAAAAHDVAAAETGLLFVEPNRQRSFGPQKATPAGTLFFLKVLRKAEHNRFRLHRCGVPCSTAVTVKVWEPGEYKVGEELSWRADQDGTYYFWNQDARDQTSREITSHDFMGSRIRITFDSGAAIEAWYVRP